MTRTEQKAEKLAKQFPGIHGIKAAAEWLGDPKSKAIHLGDIAEGGTIESEPSGDPEIDNLLKGGLPAADYYGEFRGGGPWVDPRLEKAVEALGYFVEWYDPGTMFAYPQ